MLEELIPGSVQASGKDSDEANEEKLTAFSRGEIEKLIITPKIGAFGLNWQHCGHMVFFPTYSYEQYYQAVRRHWRFGQKNKVQADIIYTEGTAFMMDGLRRKKEQAAEMFARLIEFMNNAQSISIDRVYNTKPDMPEWIRGNK